MSVRSAADRLLDFGLWLTDGCLASDDGVGMRVTDSDRLTPAVQRRRLRVELRQARLNAGLTQEAVAHAMEWSLSKLIRIEAGTVNISVNDLKVLLREYGIEDADQTENLLALARAARERSWWSGYRDVISATFFQYLEYEAAASSIRNFQPAVLPGLLQTEEYATAVLSAWSNHQREHLPVDSLVELRMRRQDLLDQANSPQFMFIIDEAVVRRMVGGKAVMRRQVEHLRDAAKRPNVTIDILPFDAGFHPKMMESFVLLEFADATDDDVLYLEASDEIFTSNAGEKFSNYRESFEQLRALSSAIGSPVEYLSGLVAKMA